LEINRAEGGNRDDGNKPHLHLIFTKGKTIMDPDVRLLEQLTTNLAKTSGCRIISHQIDFFGICPGCQKN
jgi:Fur family peroxide stress response transcriptional regulator